MGLPKMCASVVKDFVTVSPIVCLRGDIAFEVGERADTGITEARRARSWTIVLVVATRCGCGEFLCTDAAESEASFKCPILGAFSIFGLELSTVIDSASVRVG